MLSRRKLPRLTFKGLVFGEADWRGLIALSLTIGYLATLILGRPDSQVLGVAVGLVVGWYFGSRPKPKSKHARLGRVKPLKIPLATEKHKDFQAIKGRLVEALKEAGSYHPAYDDPLLGEMAKAIIDLKAVDGFVEKAIKNNDLKEFQAALKAKLNLLAMLRSMADSLAISRRSRIGRGGEKKFRETMAGRLMELMTAGSLEGFPHAEEGAGEG